MPPKPTPKTPLSHSRPLLYTTSAIATIFLGFGINAVLRPASALSFFNLDYPSSTSSPETKSLVDFLMIVYGVRDIFMALALYIAVYAGGPKVTGGIMLAACAVALADGGVCLFFGTGAEGAHWGYAPMVGGAGGVLLGFWD